MSEKDNITECTFSIFSENSPGVLHRVIVLFTRRKMNIESLTVSHTEVEGMSRFTIVVKSPADLADKIARQLRKIIEVMQVQVSRNEGLIYKEIAFFRLATPDAHTRQRIANHAVRNGAAIVAIDPDAVVIEKTGTEDEIQQLFKSFKKVQVLEFIRSGRIAIRKQRAEPPEAADAIQSESGETIM